MRYDRKNIHAWLKEDEMIGIGLKNFAHELGLNIERGVAYGLYGRYVITLKEGAGWKSVTFAVRFPNESVKGLIHAFLNDSEVKKDYRISGYNITEAMVSVTFLDNLGTLARMKQFISLMAQRLTDCGATGAECCNCCGMDFAGVEAVPVMIGENVFQMHAQCMDRVTNQQQEQKQTVQRKGSVLTGALGAVLGAVVGAIPWAVAYYYGWFVGWLGLLIGFAAKKGYEICRGKENWAKGVIVLVVVLAAVVAAEYATCLFALIGEIQTDPELASLGLTVREISRVMMEVIRTDGELRSSMVGDILIGWLFALLGIFSMLRSIFSSAKNIGTSPVRLESGFGRRD